jgi:hypothetical protein
MTIKITISFDIKKKNFNFTHSETFLLSYFSRLLDTFYPSWFFRFSTDPKMVDDNNTSHDGRPCDELR